MEGKKISFSFMKTKKSEKPVVEEKKDFIECVEENSIKVVGGEEVTQKTLLVIPMKPNTLVTAERLKQIAEKVESALEEPEIIEKPPVKEENIPDNETLDQMAVRELLQGAKEEVNVVETPTLTLPLPARPVNEGEKEATLDDYESVPVQDYGMAMLRGMGWAPNKEKSTYKQPQLRPKGLGLGADKVVKSNQKEKLSKDGKGEDLTIVKNAHVKITTGKYSGYYGKVLSLDEDNGRVMVDITVKKETVSLGEFMMHPVSKSEFDKESKVINAALYEEYKKKDTTKKDTTQKDTTQKDATQKSSRDTEDHSEKKSKDRHKDEDKYSEREATTSRSTENKYERGERSSSAKNGKDSSDRKEEEREERERDRSRRIQLLAEERAAEKAARKKIRKYDSDDSTDSLYDKKRRRNRCDPKRYSSQNPPSSEEDKKNKSNKKERKRDDSSDSEPDNRSKRSKASEGKRDIDKKRKGKKKKRDRDRSPNYRKHRK